MVGIGKVLVEKVEDEVASVGIIVLIHRDLTVEILHRGIEYRQRTEAVPEVVQREEALSPHTRRLIGQRDEGASQLDRHGEVVCEEAGTELKELCRRQAWTPRGFVHLYLVAEHEAVAAEDSSFGGVPHDELTIAVVGEVELVDVAVTPRTAAVEAEGLFSQAPDLTHRLGSRACVEDVDLVPTLIRRAKELVGGEFLADEIRRDRGDDRCGKHQRLVSVASYSSRSW